MEQREETWEQEKNQNTSDTERKTKARGSEFHEKPAPERSNPEAILPNDNDASKTRSNEKYVEVPTRYEEGPSSTRTHFRNKKPHVTLWKIWRRTDSQSIWYK